MQCRGLFKSCKTTVPSKDKTEIKFNDMKCLSTPVAIYADFEAINATNNDGGIRKTEHKVVSA